MSDDLFDDDDEPPRRRAPNKKKENARLGVAVNFTVEETGFMKHNEPPPGKKLGGWPLLENWLLANTDANGDCAMDPEWFTRTVVYFMSYRDGGPNRRVRAACAPAFKRIGIILIPNWGRGE
jgi:hypothetical protein